MSQLNVSYTNSATDSAGETFGLEGNLLVPLLAAAFLSLVCFLILPWWAAPLPFLLVAAYVFLLKNKKPPRYDLDVIDNLVHGPHWFMRPKRWIHPYVAFARPEFAKKAAPKPVLPLIPSPNPAAIPYDVIASADMPNDPGFKPLDTTHLKPQSAAASFITRSNAFVAHFRRLPFSAPSSNPSS